MKAKRRSNRRKQQFVKIYLKDPCDEFPKGIFWTAKVINATKPVTINGTFEDAMQGLPGTTIGCHLSVCAKRNAKAFPHKVLFPSFTQSRADMVSEFVYGKSYDCIAYRYKHPYGQWVRLNDEDKQKEWIKANPDKANRPFTLGVITPKARQIKENTGGRGTSVGGVRRSFVPRGALRRAISAGLMDKGIAKMLDKME